MNKLGRKSPWNGGRVTRQCHKSIYLNCAQWPVASIGPRRNVCTSESRMDDVEPLPVWYGSPIMALSFTTQPCKTKLHEIDYPHTWTSFVTPLFPPALLLSPALCLALLIFTPSENKCPNDAHIWSNGVLNYHGNTSNGSEKCWFIFFAEMSEILEASCWSMFDDTQKERNY